MNWVNQIIEIEKYNEPLCWILLILSYICTCTFKKSINMKKKEFFSSKDFGKLESITKSNVVSPEEMNKIKGGTSAAKDKNVFRTILRICF